MTIKSDNYMLALALQEENERLKQECTMLREKVSNAIRYLATTDSKRNNGGLTIVVSSADITAYVKMSDVPLAAIVNYWPYLGTNGWKFDREKNIDPRRVGFLYHHWPGKS